MVGRDEQSMHDSLSMNSFEGQWEPIDWSCFQHVLVQAVSTFIAAAVVSLLEIFYLKRMRL